jgi:hypothetical protein
VAICGCCGAETVPFSIPDKLFSEGLRETGADFEACSSSIVRLANDELGVILGVLLDESNGFFLAPSLDERIRFASSDETDNLFSSGFFVSIGFSSGCGCLASTTGITGLLGQNVVVYFTVQSQAPVFLLVLFVLGIFVAIFFF